MKNITIAMLGFLLSFGSAIAADTTGRTPPEVPASLQVADGYKVSFRALASGAQVYTATLSPTDPTKLVWTFIGPEAILYDFDGAVVGYHYAYAGPTRPAWELNSGGFVVGARSVPPVTVDPNALPWLLLDAVYTEGPGVMKRTAYIQRINTTGGLAPATPPAYAGQIARVAYTAEYVFYRAE